MSAPSKVLDLVDRFGRNLETYKRSAYKETQVRVEFIDPLFEALGWDVRNEHGFCIFRRKPASDSGRRRPPSMRHFTSLTIEVKVAGLV